MNKCVKEGFCVSARKEHEIQRVAEQVRKLFNETEDIKYLDIVKILEHKMPEAFPAFRYEIVPSSELPDREAEMNPIDFCIRIQEPIYNKAIDGDGHCRFTIADYWTHQTRQSTTILISTATS